MFDNTLNEFILNEKERSISTNENEYEELTTIDRLRYSLLASLRERILAQYHRGVRQNLTIWTAAFLRKLGFEEDETVAFLFHIWYLTKDEEQKMRMAGVKKTFEKIRRGERVKGASGLIELGIKLADFVKAIQKLTGLTLHQIVEEEKEVEEKKEVEKEVGKVRRSLVKQKILAKYKIFYDDFSKKIFIVENEKVKYVDKEVETIIHETIEDEFEKIISNEIFFDALFTAATQNKRNLLQEHLKSLRWDGKERIHNFFYDVFGVQKDDYTCTVAKNFFVGAVARALNPGCHMKNVLVLIGPQNYNKSRTVHALAPAGYSKELNVSLELEKDFFLALQGGWLIEIPEMSALRKSTTNRIKAVISSTTDRFRPPYARATHDFPRSCVFIVTTNLDDIFLDETGDTRFWPVKVKQPGNVDYVITYRDMLWAEAVMLYHEGYEYWQEPKEAEMVREKFHEIEEWENLVWPKLQGVDKITITEVARWLGIEPARIDKVVQMRIAKILRRKGFVRTLIWEDGKQKRVWLRGDEAELAQKQQVEELPWQCHGCMLTPGQAKLCEVMKPCPRHGSSKK